MRRALAQSRALLLWLDRRVDVEERRMLIQAAVVGVTVWAFVTVLKLAVVHEGFSLTQRLISHAPSVVLVWCRSR